MSDWQPGDLALCVRGGLSRGRLRAGLDENHSTMTLRQGACYTVAKVGPIVPGGFRGLSLTDAPEVPWLVSRFRKIRPHTPDAEDRETIRLLNGIPVDA